jgi:FKBP-type peptidyl-prolyl cis-trans isomerase FkpA
MGNPQPCWRIMKKLFVVIPVLLFLAACGGDGDSNPITPTPTIPPQSFTVLDLRVGTGAEAVAGKRLTVHYALWFFSTTGTDGKGQLIQTSVGSTPFSFTLGQADVIPGWDQGLVGMKVGGVRRLIVPPALAYGATGNGPIPPNTNLVFEIELLDVQ